MPGGKHRERYFPVPAEVARARDEMLAAFLAGDFAGWAESSQRLKRALAAARREMLTDARRRDIERNFGWTAALQAAE